MPNQTELEPIFTTMREHLDDLDQIREKILQLQRQTVRICSEIIKNAHRSDFDPIPQQIEKAKGLLAEMEASMQAAPKAFFTDYLQIVRQELGEAIIFYTLITLDTFPTPESCAIDPIDYAYALTDVVGELRRFALNMIRKENSDKAEHTLGIMNEIYAHLFTLDYPNGLIPGLRKKIDAARGILAKTEGDITVSVNILKLNHALEKK